MDLRQIQYFVRVAGCGSFSEAARQLFISQPALSVAMQKLEEELGFKLLAYQSKRVRLTPEGKQFFAKAAAVIAAYDDLSVSARRLSGEVTGQVTIAAPLRLCSLYLSGVVAEFCRQYPSVDVHTINRGAHIVQQALLADECDMALAVAPLRLGALTANLVERSCLVLVVPQQHRLAGAESVSVAELRDEVFVSLGENHTHYHRLLRAAATAGYVPRIAVTSAEQDFLLDLVRQGVGVCLAAKPTLTQENCRGLVSVAIRGCPELSRWEMYLAYRNDRRLSPAAEAFNRFVMQYLGVKEEEESYTGGGQRNGPPLLLGAGRNLRGRRKRPPAGGGAVWGSLFCRRGKTP